MQQIMKKEAVNLKESKDIWEGLEGGKKKTRNDVIIIPQNIP